MIGFDIGGTKCAVSIGYEENGELIVTDKKVIPTDLSISPYTMIDRMCALAEELTDKFDAIGISCGGPLSAKRGEILSPPNLPGWDNVKIVEYLENKYKGCHAYLQNDANACALAEWKYGAGHGSNSMMFFTFGTGLGAGIVIDGKIYDGASSMAGEAGHIRLAKGGPVGYGKEGSFEGFCSGNGIAQIGRKLVSNALSKGVTLPYCNSVDELSSVNAAILAKYAREGDKIAKKVFDISGKRLGQGLSVVIDILNPEIIVIGSIFTRCEDLLRRPMEKVLKREVLSHSLDACKIVGAALGEKIGDYAALTVAIEGERLRKGA